jgi:cholesterol transport system auxiliary component
MRLAPALAALALAACMPVKQHQAERYFVLAPAPVAGAPAGGPAVAVAPTTAAGFYGTTQIIYSEAPGTRGRYRYSYLTEPPQATVQAQLAARLRGAAPAGLVLDTRLAEIYHDAARAPGTVRITLTARLTDAADPARSAERVFSRSAPAASFDAAGAVAGMRTALAALLDDVVAWVRAQAPPGSSSSWNWDLGPIAPPHQGKRAYAGLAPLRHAPAVQEFAGLGPARHSFAR